MVKDASRCVQDFYVQAFAYWRELKTRFCSAIQSDFLISFCCMCSEPLNCTKPWIIMGPLKTGRIYLVSKSRELLGAPVCEREHYFKYTYLKLNMVGLQTCLLSISLWIVSHSSKPRYILMVLLPLQHHHQIVKPFPPMFGIYSRCYYR